MNQMLIREETATPPGLKDMETVNVSVGIDESSLEWARRTLERFEAIWAGHRWIPEGWEGWEIHVGAEHSDLTTVSARAFRPYGHGPEMWFKLAYRMCLDDIEVALAEFFSDLRQIDDLPDDLVSLARQPTPVPPERLMSLLRQDTSSPVLRTFNEARLVLQGIPL